MSKEQFKVFVVLFGTFVCLFLWAAVNDGAFVKCERFCNSEGQGHVGIIQDSLGTCICNNKEGHKVQKGYQLYINNKCKEL